MAAVAVGVYLVARNAMTQTLLRLMVLFTQEGGGASAGQRLENYRSSIDIWAEAPITGHGIGSWSIMAGFGDTRNYPHNIVLEVLSEGGLVGMLLLALVVAVGVGHAARRRLHLTPPGLIAIMLVVNAGLNAMVSGDLADNRYLFMTLGLLCQRRRAPAET